MLNSYLIGASFSSTADAVASIQLPRAGKIKQVVQVLSGTSVTAGQHRALTQITKNQPLSQFNTTLASPANIVAQGAVSASILTSGGNNAYCTDVLPQNTPVAPNDTLYLHVDVSGTIACTINAVIYVEE